MAKFNVGVFAVCFLLVFWTAEGAKISSHIGERAREWYECSISYCLFPILSNVGPVNDLTEAVAVLEDFGAERTIQSLQLLGSCVTSQLADTECSSSINYRDRLVYEALNDIINYVTSDEGRRLLQAAQHSVCVSDSAVVSTVQTQIQSCERQVEERISAIEDLSEFHAVVCSAVEGFQSCLTDSITSTCGGDAATLVNGVLTRGFRYYRSYNACPDGQNIASNNFFLRALRSHK